MSRFEWKAEGGEAIAFAFLSAFMALAILEHWFLVLPWPSEKLWKWVDARGKEFGIARPYLDRDPPHVAPINGQEYAEHSRGSKHARSDVTKGKRAAMRNDPSGAKRPRAAVASKMKWS